MVHTRHDIGLYADRRVVVEHRDILQDYGLHPDTVDVVEHHGALLDNGADLDKGDTVEDLSILFGNCYHSVERVDISVHGGGRLDLVRH